jgi:hypothetical protein
MIINTRVKTGFIILLITTLLSAYTLPEKSHQQDKKIANTPEQSQAKKQNIVMIMIDDLRPVLGVYGDKDAPGAKSLPQVLRESLCLW